MQIEKEPRAERTRDNLTNFVACSDRACSPPFSRNRVHVNSRECKRRENFMDATERWRSRCEASGLGYLLQLRSRQSHELPAALFDGLTLSSTGTGHESCDSGAGKAIDDYIQMAKSLSDDVFAPLARAPCPGCGRSQRWYCSRCEMWMDNVPEAHRQPLALPFQLTVIVRDAIEDSTGIHAAALATPVVVRHFPHGLRNDVATTANDEPWIRFDASSIVLYPSPGSMTVAELVEELCHTAEASRVAGAAEAAECKRETQSHPRPTPLCTIIVIDSKWHNDGAVLEHPSIRGLRRVRLEHPPDTSRIWRSHARATAGCLSTIEAVYCFAREFTSCSRRRQMELPNLGLRTHAEDREPGSSCCGYEPLLLLFALIHHRIASQTRAGDQAPFEPARKAAALAHRKLSAAKGSRAAPQAAPAEVQVALTAVGLT